MVCRLTQSCLNERCMCYDRYMSIFRAGMSELSGRCAGQRCYWASLYCTSTHTCPQLSRWLVQVEAEGGMREGGWPQVPARYADHWSRRADHWPQSWTETTIDSGRYYLGCLTSNSYYPLTHNLGWDGCNLDTLHMLCQTFNRLDDINLLWNVWLQGVDNSSSSGLSTWVRAFRIFK